MSDLDDALRELGGRNMLVRMLTYAIRCPQVARIAAQKLQPMHFNEATQFEFVIVWHVASAMIREYSQPPTEQQLVDVSLNVLHGQGRSEPALQDSVQRLAHEVYAYDEQPWHVEYGMRLLNAFFNQVFIRELTQLGQQYDSRDAVVDAIAQVHQHMRIESAQIMDPFDLETNQPNFLPRVPTGVMFFDTLIGGGILPSEVYGVLGPSGGGKTVMAIQLACSLAERNMRVEYFTYEQPVRDLQPRVLACASKTDISRIAGKQWCDLDNLDRETIMAAAKQSKSYLRLHDRSSEGDNLADVIDVIRTAVDEERKPAMVILDWIWPLVLRATQASGRRNVEERKILQAMTNDIKAAAAKYDVAFLVLHQVSTELAKKSANAKPEWFNSAEAGSFAWLMHYCLAIGGMDPAGYCWLVGSKARNAKKQSLLVQLKGSVQRFVGVDKMMEYDRDRKSFVARDDANHMPGVVIDPQETEASPPAQDEDDYGALPGVEI